MNPVSFSGLHQVGVCEGGDAVWVGGVEAFDWAVVACAGEGGGDVHLGQGRVADHVPAGVEGGCLTPPPRAPPPCPGLRVFASMALSVFIVIRLQKSLFKRSSVTV